MTDRKSEVNILQLLIPNTEPHLTGNPKRTEWGEFPGRWEYIYDRGGFTDSTPENIK
jgi:hypothetical protein